MSLFTGLLLCLLSLCSACTVSVQEEPTLEFHGQAKVTFYVIRKGWHTGLALRRGDIPQGVWPESADFPSADYLELGWGDWDYYQSDDPGLWLALKAAFWPTASVLHVAGVNGEVTERFAGYEIIRLDVATDGFARLAHYIHRSFARGGENKARPIGPGFGQDSLFYPAQGRFHLLNNCNSWTARALRAAGYPVGPLLPVMPGQLMAKVRPFAVPANESKSLAPPAFPFMPD